MATLKEVAAEAGVSVATVSYALHGGKNVSQHTASAVRKAARKLNYQANISARNLKQGSSKIIEIAVHELDLPYFFSKFSTVAAKIIDGRGYCPLVLQTGMNKQSVKDAVDAISNQLCDGIILNATGVNPRILKRLGAGRPTVLLDDCSREPVLDTVNTSNEARAYMATCHLIEVGCRRILMLGGDDTPLSDSPTALINTRQLRYRGFRQALDEAGLCEMPAANIDVPELVVEPGRVAAFAIAQRMETEAGAIDGVVCASDSLALGLLRGLREQGIAVPEALKVIGMDGISVNQYMSPSLSSVEIDMEDFAQKAVDLLLDRVSGSCSEPPRRVEAKFNLVVRESTGESR